MLTQLGIVWDISDTGANKIRRDNSKTFFTPSSEPGQALIDEKWHQKKFDDGMRRIMSNPALFQNLMAIHNVGERITYDHVSKSVTFQIKDIFVKMDAVVQQVSLGVGQYCLILRV